MVCPEDEVRISKVFRSIPQDLLVEEGCESRKALAVTREVTRPGGRGVTVRCSQKGCITGMRTSSCTQCAHSWGQASEKPGTPVGPQRAWETLSGWDSDISRCS